MENSIKVQLDSVSCCVSCINNTPESTSSSKLSNKKSDEKKCRPNKLIVISTKEDENQLSIELFFTLSLSRVQATQQAKAHASLRLDFISLECRHRDLAKACDSTFVCHHHLLRVWFAFFPSLSSSFYPVNIFYCYCLRTSSKRCLILVLVRFINPRMNKKSEKKDKRVRAKRRSVMSQVSSGTNWHIFSSSPGRSRSVASTKSIFVQSQSQQHTKRGWRNTHKFCCLAATEYAICHIYHRQIDSLLPWRNHLSRIHWIAAVFAFPACGWPSTHHCKASINFL